MSRPDLESTVIVSGDRTQRVYEERGILYPAKPVPRFIEFEINNIKEQEIKEINLYEYFGMDLIARGLTADIAADDKSTLSDKGSMPNPTIVESIVDVLEGDRLENRLKFYFTSFPDYVNHIVINHRRKWRIRCNETVNKLTFYCEPVYVDNIIRVS